MVGCYDGLWRLGETLNDVEYEIYMQKLHRVNCTLFVPMYTLYIVQSTPHYISEL